MKRWTYNQCFDAAKKCKSKKEFKLIYPKEFKAAYRQNWLEECCRHMIPLGSIFKRLIYAFEFPDKSVYIGLTYNPKKREHDHYIDVKSQVYQHIKLTKQQPEFKELTEYFDRDIATIKEGELLNKYYMAGWNILNKAKTGGLGGIIRKWTKEKCMEKALNFKFRNEFKKSYPSAYFSACKNKWLIEICQHMDLQQKPNNHWTFENCKIEALKYNKKSDFTKNSIGAYLKAQRNGWLNLIRAHMIN